MHEHNRRALARLFVIKPRAVARADVRHHALPTGTILCMLMKAE
jgi:hypothetical protein